MESYEKTDKTTEKAKIKKQNQDFANLPAASEEIKKVKPAKKEIRKTSEINEDGKTDNTEQES